MTTMIVKNKKTAEDRAFWAHCEAVAAEVSLWPAWMRGEAGTQPEVAVRRTDDAKSEGFGSGVTPAGSGTHLYHFAACSLLDALDPSRPEALKPRHVACQLSSQAAVCINTVHQSM
jgi:hypothetical protein